MITLTEAPDEIRQLKGKVSEVQELVGSLRNAKFHFAKEGEVLKEIKKGLLRVQDKLDRAASWFPGLLQEGENQLARNGSAKVQGRRSKRAIGLVAGGVAIAAVAGMSIASLVKVGQLETEVEAQGRSIKQL